MTTILCILLLPVTLGLGPTLTIEVKLEGIPVKALVKTGSPSTIMSLKFLINALVNRRNPTSPLSGMC